MQRFDFNDFTVQFSMLHDQVLTGATFEDGVLRLIFGEYEIFRENYADDTYFNRYKDFRSCMVEILVHSFPLPELNTFSLCMLKGELYRYMEMDTPALMDFIAQLHATFTFASISNNDEIELQLFSSVQRQTPRKYRGCEFRFGVYSDAIKFIWQ